MAKKKPASPSLAELKEHGERLLASRRGPCGCAKADRRPQTKHEGNFVVTVCARCKGYTS